MNVGNNLFALVGVGILGIVSLGGAIYLQAVGREVPVPVWNTLTACVTCFVTFVSVSNSKNDK